LGSPRRARAYLCRYLSLKFYRCVGRTIRTSFV